MRKTFVVVFIIVIASLPAVAQKYRTAAGIRIGSGIGVSVQQYLWDKFTLEGIVQKNLFKSGTHVSALFESHNKLLFKGLNFYLGAGPHFGFYGSGVQSDSKTSEESIAIKNAVGVSAIGGLEMRLNRVLLSYDYQPGINFSGGEQVFNSQTGLTVRYIFLKAKKKELNWMFWKKWQKYDGGED
jgi:hypothetical protein